MKKRYRDLYRAARALVSFGMFMKVLGTLLAVAVMVALLVAAATLPGIDDRYRLALGAGAGFVGGLLAGLPLYVLGMLLSAQGQLLRATADTAVNTSPFLTNGERAEIIGVEAPPTAVAMAATGSGSPPRPTTTGATPAP